MTPKNSHPPMHERFSVIKQEPSVTITIKIASKSLKQYVSKIKNQTWAK